MKNKRNARVVFDTLIDTHSSKAVKIFSHFDNEKSSAIIRCLYQPNVEPLTANQICKQIGYVNIRGTLRSLEATGVITSERINRFKYYSLDGTTYNRVKDATRKLFNLKSKSK